MNAFDEYAESLRTVLAGADWSGVAVLADELISAWNEDRRLFLCGNGGSAANALHLANDFLYGVARPHGRGLAVTALSANVAVLTCLANDLSYDAVYAQQLETLARPGDVLVVLSGSGNSPNILRALEAARTMGLHSYAVLGYDGGAARTLADTAIHFPIADMQISEDLQLVVGHMLMRRLNDHHRARLEKL